MKTLRASLDSWSRRARPSAQAVASPGQVKTGHLRVFGRPAQQSQAAMWSCLGGTWEPGRQPNCHQPPRRGGVCWPERGEAPIKKKRAKKKSKQIHTEQHRVD
jgi:hypothetical protein